MFGGIMMQWIDVCAGVAAMRHSAGAVLTASIDRLDFLSPVQVGEIVVLQAQVNYVARTSMEVGCRVETEDMHHRTRRYVTKAYLTFVAVDPGGRPRPVPALELESEHDRRRHLQPELLAELLQWTLPLSLVVHAHQVDGGARVPCRPWQHVACDDGLLRDGQPHATGRGARDAHGQASLGRLEPFERHLSKVARRQPEERVPEVVHLTIALHHVCKVGVVDKADRCTLVWIKGVLLEECGIRTAQGV